MPPFVVPGVLDSLSILRERVGESARLAGLSDAAAYALCLAVDEIATNIILHGYEEHGMKGDVGVLIEQTPTELVVTLEDTAPAYDPRSHNQPAAEDLGKPLEDRTIGGLGVFLALQGVDRFDYEWKNGRNRNIFAMKLPPAKGTGQ